MHNQPNDPKSTATPNKAAGPAQPNTPKPGGNYQAKGDEKPPVVAQSVPPIPGVDAIKLDWPKQVNAARSTWGKLSEEELRQSDGQPSKLATLVQERYSVTRQEADKQVNSFLETCNKQ
ncbi:hypothetical protein [Chitinimonas sp. BJYL2]|uniref:CsbD family protein n=1 Tax=Chitinimonas sp. BJYL2 TaxID=2976696 RepID=UPI0022B2B88B|nr:hypothetical protein [Chitinimonas sp. BJYL2]